MKKYFLVVLIFFSLNSHSQSNILIGNTHVEVDTIITGLDVPWEILYGPDGYLWITERKGIVSRVDPNTGVKEEVLNLVSSVFQASESGMLGMALHPDFNNTPEVFIAYTWGGWSISYERIVKYTFDGTTLQNEEILLDYIPSNSFHIGCRLLILPDLTMIISTGDAGYSTSAQSLIHLNGKILRMNLDGSIPSDNPIANSYIYSFGHRNTQGIAFGPNNNIYLSEHGNSSDDEFQILEENRNYGWPNVEGFCNTTTEMTFCDSNYVKEPIFSWTPTLAPSDMIYYENSLFPEFNQKMLMTVLKDKKVIAIELDPTGTILLDQQHYLTNMFGRIRDICVGPNKEIYLVTNGSSWTNIDPNTHSIIVLKPINTVSTFETKKTMETTLFPNPIIDKLTINLENNLKIASINVFDVTGNLMFNLLLQNVQTKVDMSSLNSGIYFVQLIDENGVESTHKIFKL